MSRAWVIGSGASLKETPLHLLKDEQTYAMNRIHLLYDRTDWRPTYYFMVDHNQQNPKDYWRECIEAHWDTPKWLWSAFRDGLPKVHPNHDTLKEGIGQIPNTTWIERCERHHYYPAAPGNKGMHEWHLPELCTGYSGMSTLMQIAVLNGASEIYLLGCDNYGPDYTKNHFETNYTLDFRDRSEHDNANMNKLHEVAKESAGIPVFNATIGGYLEVHPRVDILEVLGAN